MKSIVIAALIATASVASSAQDLCPRGQAFLDKLMEAGVKPADLSKHMGRAVSICAEPQHAAPKTREEYMAAKRLEAQRQVDAMNSQPKVQPIRLWGEK